MFTMFLPPSPFRVDILYGWHPWCRSTSPDWKACSVGTDADIKLRILTVLDLFWRRHNNRIIQWRGKATPPERYGRDAMCARSVAGRLDAEPSWPAPVEPTARRLQLCSSFDDGRRELGADQPANWLISSRFRAGRRSGRVNMRRSDTYRCRMGVGRSVGHSQSTTPISQCRVSRLCWVLRHLARVNRSSPDTQIFVAGKCQWRLQILSRLRHCYVLKCL